MRQGIVSYSEIIPHPVTTEKVPQFYPEIIIIKRVPSGDKKYTHRLYDPTANKQSRMPVYQSLGEK